MVANVTSSQHRPAIVHLACVAVRIDKLHDVRICAVALSGQGTDYQWEYNTNGSLEIEHSSELLYPHLEAVGAGVENQVHLRG